MDDAFIAGLPKAELHVHVEGTLEPELMFELAERNGLALPFRSPSEARAAYAFTNLGSFLDVYYLATRVLRTERDFYDMTRAYLRRAHTDGVRHVEIFFDPQSHTRRGVPLDAVVGGLSSALDEGPRDFGMTTGLIACFLRDLGGEEALATWEELRPFRDRLLGVGLDSAERDHPPDAFRRVFREATTAGLRRVAHAGEEGPPDYIWESLEVLGAERIDHGVRAEEDPVLMDVLRERQIPLTVCPLSNVELGVFDSLENHNLGHLLGAGLRVTINSDDPAYFGGYIADNYRRSARALHLDRDVLVRCARNSIEGAFVEEPRRCDLLAELERFVA